MMIKFRRILPDHVREIEITVPDATSHDRLAEIASLFAFEEHAPRAFEIVDVPDHVREIEITVPDATSHDRLAEIASLFAFEEHAPRAFEIVDGVIVPKGAS